ncbi:60S ribosomal protein L37A [Histoplasma capsulatum var. duboisii H88]|uniref:60S ribosomal protein L37A n=1 Tax=Ajellomyces capsulatus (strain H88) TaxID=544711 RepID=A0A8A1L763_AJEC8|nr:60S ribosomal protein L37A [Histoplasma capsulatum var. duboisii H88]
MGFSRLTDRSLQRPSRERKDKSNFCISSSQPGPNSLIGHPFSWSKHTWQALFGHLYTFNIHGSDRPIHNDDTYTSNFFIYHPPSTANLRLPLYRTWLDKLWLARLPCTAANAIMRKVANALKNIEKALFFLVCHGNDGKEQFPSSAETICFRNP